MAPEQPQESRFGFDRKALAAVVVLGVVCMALVGIAWVASRNAPSSTTGNTAALPVPSVDADQGCDNFGTYWSDTSGANIDPVALELFTNCRLGDDGSWFATQTMYGAGTLDESTLTDEQRAQLEAARMSVAQQVDGLEAALPGSVREAFAQLHTAKTNAVVGNFKEGVAWGPYRTRYARIMNAYLLDPANAELASFAGWIMSRKLDGYGQLRQQCLANEKVEMLQTACRGMEDNLSIRYAPLPWVLRDPELLDTWFYETVVKPTQTQE